MASDQNQAAGPEMDWEKTLEEAAVPSPAEKPPVKSPDQPVAVAAGKGEGSPNLTLLLDIPLEITAELGRP